MRRSSGGANTSIAEWLHNAGQSQHVKFKLRGRQVPAFNLKCVLNILGVAGMIKAMRMAASWGPEGLLAPAMFDQRKLDVSNLIDPTAISS
jgi:hypothetical protein